MLGLPLVCCHQRNLQALRQGQIKAILQRMFQLNGEGHSRAEIRLKIVQTGY